MAERHHLPGLPALVPGHATATASATCAGILERLDYLEWLGVDAIWLSPIYPSPMARLRLRHLRLLRRSTRSSARWRTSTRWSRRRTRAACSVILDFVPEPHLRPAPVVRRVALGRDEPEARLVHLARPRARTAARRTTGSRTSAAAPGTCDERTGQYYYHALPARAARPELAQPRGASRRCSTCCASGSTAASTASASTCSGTSSRTTEFRDNPPNPDYVPDQGPYDALLPRLLDRPARGARHRAARCARCSTAYGRPAADRRDLPAGRAARHLLRRGLRRRAPAVQLPADRAALGRAHDQARPSTRTRRLLPQGGWPNWVLGNHDQHRIASRIGRAQARVAAMLLLTLRGTPTMYYGDEIGMTDVPDPARARCRTRTSSNVPGPRPRPRPGAHADAVGRARRTPASRRATLAAARRRTHETLQRRSRARRPDARCSRSTAG